MANLLALKHKTLPILKKTTQFLKHMLLFRVFLGF